jgi:hypothetical protein
MLICHGTEDGTRMLQYTSSRPSASCAKLQSRVEDSAGFSLAPACTPRPLLLPLTWCSFDSNGFIQCEMVPRGLPRMKGYSTPLTSTRSAAGIYSATRLQGNDVHLLLSISPISIVIIDWNRTLNTYRTIGQHAKVKIQTPEQILVRRLPLVEHQSS